MIALRPSTMVQPASGVRRCSHFQMTISSESTGLFPFKFCQKHLHSRERTIVKSYWEQFSPVQDFKKVSSPGPVDEYEFFFHRKISEWTFFQTSKNFISIKKQNNMDYGQLRRVSRLPPQSILNRAS